MHAIGRKHGGRFNFVDHGIGSAVTSRLAADGINTTIGPSASYSPGGQFVIDIVDLRKVNGLGASRLSHSQAFWNFIDSDDAPRAH